MLQKGIRFKVSVIKASLVTYKITSPLNDCMDVIKKWALGLKDRANDDISNLQHSLDLWNNSPTMFKSKRSVLGTKFSRIDDEKPKYSYQAIFGEFEEKEWYENVIKEKAQELTRWSKLDKNTIKYLYSIMRSKHFIAIHHLNEINFEFYK